MKKATIVFALLSIIAVIHADFSTNGITAEGKEGDQTKIILDKMIEAIGGKEAIAKVQDSSYEGTIEFITFGMNGSMNLYQKEPDKMRMDIHLQGRIVTQAYDGEMAWGTDPNTGMSIEFTGPVAEEIKKLAYGNDSLLNPDKYGISYSYKGKEMLEGKEYFVLNQTFPDGKTITHYIDPQTYHTYKTKGKALNSFGVEVDQESYISDYKKAGDIITAHSIIVFEDGKESLKMIISNVNLNTGLEDSFFKMNPESE